MVNKKVAIYIRTSTDKQKESIELQTEELTKYCQLKGYEIYNNYVDFGYSGKNTDRPAFNLLMEDAKDKKFDVVLTTKIDRFARSILDLLVTVEKLKEYEIDYAATDQPIDTSSAMGTLTLQIMASFAEFERKIINERMKAGREAAEKNGKICHRPRKEISRKKLEELVGKGLSANACGKFFGVTASTITHRLVEYGYVYENGEWRIKYI
ncbi:recombinase family protein [Methanococcoides sp. LMO-2]|uniref:Recombinase family protein n=1 Tax=Methanococcoides cohabitans TaxID=3136559 RepID=A0ABU9KYS8_9EURY